MKSLAGYGVEPRGFRFITISRKTYVCCLYSLERTLGFLRTAESVRPRVPAEILLGRLRQGRRLG